MTWLALSFQVKNENDAVLSWISAPKPKNFNTFNFHEFRFFPIAVAFYRYNTQYIFNPLMHNVPKWSDTLYKSCSIFCKIFKVCLTILGHYALKG